MDPLFIEKLKKEIDGFSPREEREEIGVVMTAGDGVANIDGLSNVQAGEMVQFVTEDGVPLKDAMKKENELFGMVLNLEEETVRIVVLGDIARVYEGMRVKRTGTILSIPVSTKLIGRVVTALGEPLDGKGEIVSEAMYQVERKAYGVIERAPVDTPLHTGIKAIDGMIPIGRGQRELIIGDRYSGKTTLAVDTILNQKNEPESERPVCIYVAIGQKESKVKRLIAELEKRGAMDYTIVISAGAAVPTPLQFLAPFAGAAVGEYFMESGRDALVVYDDLSKHAVAYRELSLLLKRPPGREAYPGDIFYLHSRLLERAAKLSVKLGGGSLTALPIIETQEGDVSSYIPTNVISITDGQIYLDSEIFNKGLKPAINVGLSVSRVGSNAQTKAMKKVAGKIRLELAQFRELEAFMQFSDDLDEDTKKRISRGERLTAVLTQKKHAPLPFERQVPIIYAAISGFLDDIPVERISETEEKLLLFIEETAPDVYDDIKKEKDLTKGIEEKLRKTIEAFLLPTTDY